MTDPYKVLGVPTTATDDEVKAAYRKLAKKYHPDANPGDKVAEQRMKEINAAYDQIMNKSSSTTADGGYGGYTGYDPFGRSYGGRGSQQQGDPKLQAAYNYLSFGRYREALNVLDSIDSRTAQWYYYSAVANSGLGNTARALEHARTAVRMEPNNSEYAELLEHMQSGGARYSPFGGFGGGGYGRMYNCSGVSRLWLGLCAVPLIFNLCCGNSLCCGRGYGGYGGGFM